MKTMIEIWQGLRLESLKFAHYLPLYERYLTPFRETTGNILEIGVCAGGSLEMWREYFPKARIWGLDIDQNAPRITQLNPWLDRVEILCASIFDPQTVKRLAGIPWTVVIDDGPHRTKQQIATAKALLPALTCPGVYLCEDLFPEQRGKLIPSLPMGRAGAYGWLRGKLGLGFGDWANRLPVRSDVDGAVTGVHKHDGVVVIEKTPCSLYYVDHAGKKDGRYCEA